jgi:hypothetical protein
VTFFLLLNEKFGLIVANILFQIKFVYITSGAVPRRTLIRANETCMTELPRAAEAVMGR